MELPLILRTTFSEKGGRQAALEIPLALKQGISKLFIMDQKQLHI